MSSAPRWRHGPAFHLSEDGSHPLGVGRCALATGAGLHAVFAEGAVGAALPAARKGISRSLCAARLFSLFSLDHRPGHMCAPNPSLCHPALAGKPWQKGARRDKDDKSTNSPRVFFFPEE